MGDASNYSNSKVNPLFEEIRTTAHLQEGMTPKIAPVSLKKTLKSRRLCSRWFNKYSIWSSCSCEK